MAIAETTARDWVCSHDEYHAAVDVVGHSALDCFRDSRKNYHAVYVAKTEPPSEPSESMILGTLCHLALLEPEKWGSSTISLPKCDRRTKTGKAEYADWIECSKGKVILSQAHAEIVPKLCEAVRNNEVAYELLFGLEGPIERGIVWTDKATGLRCKCRPDKVARGAIADLKFLSSRGGAGMGPEVFARIAHGFGYHRAATWYIDGYKARYGREVPFIFIACSTTPPFEVACYDLCEESLDLGRDQNAAALADLARCLQSGDWVSPHEQRVTKVSLPRYAFSKDYAL